MARFRMENIRTEKPKQEREREPRLQFRHLQPTVRNWSCGQIRQKMSLSEQILGSFQMLVHQILQRAHHRGIQT